MSWYDPLLSYLFPKSEEALALESIELEDLRKLLVSGKENDKNFLFEYQNDSIKRIVWLIKYKGNRVLIKKISKLLFERLETLGKDLVVLNVPISSQRLFERGFNQTELLLEGVREVDKNKKYNYLFKALEKSRNTQSQTGTHSKEERLLNLKNSIRVLNPDGVFNKEVVVLDDVLTTGATFLECKRALEEAGAKKVLLLTIAH